jgi:RNA polymerase sigma factor (sigma-70 family)
MNEENFILRLSQGDSSAYKDLIAEQSNRIFKTVIPILKNSNDAQDITQEVFIEIFKSLPSFRGKSTLSTWIHRIAINKAYDYLKKKKCKKRFAGTEPLFIIDSVLPLTDKRHFDDPGALLENKELSVVLFQSINKLRKNQRTAFILRKIEGLSYIEISKIMQKSIPSIEGLIFNATQNMREKLRNYYEKSLS